MQKKLIVAALAGLVAAPFAAQAQSSVEVYGILGVGYKSVDREVDNGVAKVTTRTIQTGANGQNSGSRLGFRGTEDLGNGLKAGFTVEYGIDPTENNALGGASATLLTRQAFASLSGGFGEVRIGRQNSLNKDINDGYTAFGGAGFDTGWTTSIAGHINATDRQSNTITYATPTVSGLVGKVQWVKETSDNNSVNGRTQTLNGARLGLWYNLGPLSAGYAHADLKTEAEGAANKTTTKTDTLGASYDFGAAKAYLTHNRSKQEVDGVNGRAKANDSVVGVRVPFGATSLWAQYGKGKNENAAGTAKNDVKGYQIGAVYALSKRTMVFGFYGDDETKSTAGATNKVNNDGYTIGVQHNF